MRQIHLLQHVEVPIGSQWLILHGWRFRDVRSCSPLYVTAHRSDGLLAGGGPDSLHPRALSRAAGGFFFSTRDFTSANLMERNLSPFQQFSSSGCFNVQVRRLEQPPGSFQRILRQSTLSMDKVKNKIFKQFEKASLCLSLSLCLSCLFFLCL